MSAHSCWNTDMDDREHPLIWLIIGWALMALFTPPDILATVAIIVGLAGGPAFILFVVRSLNSRDGQKRGDPAKDGDSFLAWVRSFRRSKFAAIGYSAFALCALTVLFPPWVKVRADWELTGFGFGSHELKVHETHFAGYDFLMSKAKQPQHDTSGASHELTYYRVLKELLAAEWIAICACASTFHRRR